MKKISVIFMMVVLSTLFVKAQDHVVHGIVHTLDSIPLIGVEISIKSTKQKVVTDSLGRFTAFCNKKEKLKLRAFGFYDQTVKIPDDSKVIAINMKLKPGEKQRDIAIGYGYVSEDDLTGAVSNLKIRQTDYSRYEKVSDIIRSMGAQIRNGEITLRGERSFQGTSGALIVVDGTITDYDYMEALRPTDIKRIDILKDAAASVYGSRGANGVVLIETASGK